MGYNLTKEADFNQVRNWLLEIANTVRGDVERIPQDSNAAALGLDSSVADLEIVVKGEKGFINSSPWAVAVLVFDKGDACDILFEPLGLGMLQRAVSSGLDAFAGTYNRNVKLSTSNKIAAEMYNALKAK